MNRNFKYMYDVKINKNKIHDEVLFHDNRVIHNYYYRTVFAMILFIGLLINMGTPGIYFNTEFESGRVRMSEETISYHQLDLCSTHVGTYIDSEFQSIKISLGTKKLIINISSYEFSNMEEFTYSSIGGKEILLFKNAFGYSAKYEQNNKYIEIISEGYSKKEFLKFLKTIDRGEKE